MTPVSFRRQNSREVRSFPPFDPTNILLNGQMQLENALVDIKKQALEGCTQ